MASSVEPVGVRPEMPALAETISSLPKSLASAEKSRLRRMFRKSTGESPHQFVLRQRIERAKGMLRVPDARALDVAVACGFKTQQHFAQVFRDVCGTTPTVYRQDCLGSEVTGPSETRPEDTHPSSACL